MSMCIKRSDSGVFTSSITWVHNASFDTERAVQPVSYTVQTGVPADQIVATLSLFRRYLFLLSPFALFAAAAGGHWLSRKALSPVDAITRSARNIGGSNLSGRLEKLTTGDELQRYRIR